MTKFHKIKHLPFSPGVGNRDDKIHDKWYFERLFKNKVLVISKKLDGEQFCMNGEDETVYARSHSKPVKGDQWGMLKGIMAQFVQRLKAGNVSVFGENLMAERSIHYKYLYSPYFLFSVRDDYTNGHMNWDELMYWSKLLGIPTVPVMRVGTFSRKNVFEGYIKKIAALPHMGEVSEGVVIRTWEGFKQEQAEDHTGKWVREDHVQGNLPRKADIAELYKG